jgi:hypothetical protein
MSWLQIVQRVRAEFSPRPAPARIPRTAPALYDNPVLHRSGIEPFSDQAQDHRIRNAVGHHLAQPLTIYAGEIAADVGFDMKEQNRG